MAPDRLVDAEGTHRLGGRAVESGDALVIATSGATGTPKGVVLTHDAVRASAVATSARLGITHNDKWLACLPLAHIGGLAVITRAIQLDVPLVVHDGFNTEQVQAAARDGATAVSLVATALQRVDPTLFRVIVLGGSRPPAERPANVHTTYGMTETGSGVVYDGMPLEGVEVAFAPSGEILLRCPMLLRCYRDGSTPVDADGWLHTGDLGTLLDDGRLHVAGRADDLIISGGENIWPEVVENAIASHAAVRDIAIVGVPDSEWGQRVVAWIVPNAEPPTLAEIRAHILEAMPAFCVPKELHIVDALPRTALGKLRRHLLK